MRDDAFACIRRVGVETGGSNIQFAVDPRTGHQLVIEMNPQRLALFRVASKATGFPIAKIVARLAIGYTLDEIENEITRATPASFEPTIDYVVTKVPRWAFEKLPGVPDRLGTRMQSVGEVMAIGRTFPESFQKALRGLEQGRFGLNCDPGEVALDALGSRICSSALLAESAAPLRSGSGAAPRCEHRRGRAGRPGSTRWFLDQIVAIFDARAVLDEAADASQPLAALDRADWRYLKRLGFSDRADRVAPRCTRGRGAAACLSAGVPATFKTVDTCGAEFEAETPYYYSTFEDEDEVRPAERPPS